MAHNSYRPAIVLLAFSLIISFFLPWVDSFFKINAIEIVFGPASKQIGSFVKYFLLLIPASAFAIAYFELFTNGRYLVSKNLLLRLPLAISIVMLGLSIREIAQSARGFRSSDINRLLGMLGVGFWIMLVAATLLALFTVSFKLRPRLSKA